MDVQYSGWWGLTFNPTMASLSSPCPPQENFRFFLGGGGSHCEFCFIGCNKILGPLCWPVTGTIYLILFLRRADPLIKTFTFKIFLESGKFSSIYVFSVHFMHWKLWVWLSFHIPWPFGALPIAGPPYQGSWIPFQRNPVPTLVTLCLEATRKPKRILGFQRQRWALTLNS